MTVPAPPRPAPLPSTLPTDRTLVMGVINVTPDSFSDGGRWLSPDAAIAHARTLLDQRGAKDLRISASTLDDVFAALIA